MYGRGFKDSRLIRVATDLLQLAVWVRLACAGWWETAGIRRTAGISGPSHIRTAWQRLADAREPVSATYLLLDCTLQLQL